MGSMNHHRSRMLAADYVSLMLYLNGTPSAMIIARLSRVIGNQRTVPRSTGFNLGVNCTSGLCLMPGTPLRLSYQPIHEGFRCKRTTRHVKIGPRRYWLVALHQPLRANSVFFVQPIVCQHNNT